VYPRGFAHLTLQPKDAASLAKCLALYNGARWRGGVLRCRPAKPGFEERRVLREKELLEKEAAALDPAQRAAPTGQLLVWNSERRAYVLVLERGNGSQTAVDASGILPVLGGEAADETEAQSTQPFQAPSWDALDSPKSQRYAFEALLQRLAPKPDLEALAEGRLYDEDRERMERILERQRGGGSLRAAAEQDEEDEEGASSASSGQDELAHFLMEEGIEASDEDSDE
ncbi:hypothetical protein H632_c3752p0, partial [Helicosporidium sp. ATCC 50920]